MCRGNKLCFCLTPDTAATLIGILQLNALLYFFFRFTCIVKYYWVPDVIFTLAYLMRVLAFFRCVYKKRDSESRH